MRVSMEKSGTGILPKLMCKRERKGHTCGIKKNI